MVATGIVLAAAGVPTYPDAVTTAAALIIGDEILSGKVRDTNAPLLIDLFRELGVELGRLVYLADEVDEIATEVRKCADSYDAVITSGGVGPTHDDCTIEGPIIPGHGQGAGVPFVDTPVDRILVPRSTGVKPKAAVLGPDKPAAGSELADQIYPEGAQSITDVAKMTEDFRKRKFPALRAN